MAEKERDPGLITSTGLGLSESSWLDTHFEACRPEYEAQLRAVGIRPGWRVLDAASGAGSYLPWIADLVGPEGQLAALDLTPENVAIVERRLAAWALPCPVEVGVGNVTALPYPDGYFDAVWFANTAQYLSADEFRTALGEFRRVVRPGGLVSVKDTTSHEYCSLPPFLLSRLKATIGMVDDPTGQQWSAWIVRTPLLRRWLERAGLENVWQRGIMIERWAPYESVERQLLLDIVPYCVAMAAQYGMPAEDQAAWARANDPSSAAHPANDPEGYFVEGNVLAVGRVPGGLS